MEINFRLVNFTAGGRLKGSWTIAEVIIHVVTYFGSRTIVLVALRTVAASQPY